MTQNINTINETVDYYIDNCSESYIIHEVNLKEIKDKIVNFFSREENIKKFTKNLENKNKKIKKETNRIKSDLNNHGIDIKKIEKAILSKKKNLESEIKKGSDYKTIGEKLTKFFQEIFHMDDVKDEMEKHNIMNSKIRKAFIIFVFTMFAIVLLSILSAAIFVPIFGPSAGQITALFSIIVISPVVEEYAKYISIKKKATGQFFLLFNLYEFFSYVIRFVIIGISIPVAIGYRILPVLMHALTTYIMFKFRRKEVKDVDNKEEITQTKGYPKTSLAVGILIHFIWNLQSVVVFA